MTPICSAANDDYDNKYEMTMLVKIRETLGGAKEGRGEDNRFRTTTKTTTTMKMWSKMLITDDYQLRLTMT